LEKSLDLHYFFAEWTLSWADQRLNVHANWKVVSGDIAGYLNERPAIELGTQDFLNEWIGPLETIANRLRLAGYTSTLKGYDVIQELVARHPSRGALYRSHETTIQEIHRDTNSLGDRR
jgi:hypothetical protein